MTEKKIVKKTNIKSKNPTASNFARKEAWLNSSGNTTRYEHYYYSPNYYPYRKLYRSTRNKLLGGVCGGLAEYFNQDPLLIRLVWVAITIVSIGLGVIAYLLFWLFVDKYPVYYPYGTTATTEYSQAATPKETQDIVHVHYHY